MNFPISSSWTDTHHHYIYAQEYLLLQRLDCCKSMQELKQIHCYMIKTSASLKTQQLIYSKIISICAAVSPFKDLNYAHSLFTKLLDPDIAQYNAIIRCFSGFKDHNLFLVVMSLYCELLMKGLIPDNYTYPFLLKACAQNGAIREGEMVHGQVIKNGLVLDLYVVNTLMRLYAVCGVIGAVRKLFDGSPLRDLISWTTLIQGYVDTGYWREGVELFFSMCEAGFRADEMTMAVVTSACAKLGDLRLGKKIHNHMQDCGMKFDVFVGNALVDMYIKCGDADLACKVFNEMPVKNVVSWNTKISGLAQQGKYREALDAFNQMQRRGIKPDNVTLVGVLNSCGNLGVLELGKWIHRYVDKIEIKADGFVGNALIDMYAKCGSIDDAFRVFEGIKCRDVYTYTAMIVGLAMHGRGDAALELFSEMPKVGIVPNEVTFIGVLTACSHAGLLSEGWKHFEDMLSVYNLKPQAEHYGCMADLLGRAGLISEAVIFIENMPIDPDALVWGALLAACRIHGNIELAEVVTEKLINIESEKEGPYILMSNIYSSRNKWRKALHLRRIIKEKKMRKIPGSSSIELDGKIHEFRKGDKTHPKTLEIYMLLEEMMSNEEKN